MWECPRLGCTSCSKSERLSLQGLPQVWLQQFAWTEAEKPGRLADRAEHGRTPGAAASLAEEPMFCMETALKALYWATLVYRYDERAPDLTRDKPLRVGLPLNPKPRSQTPNETLTSRATSRYWPGRSRSSHFIGRTMCLPGAWLLNPSTLAHTIPWEGTLCWAHQSAWRVMSKLGEESERQSCRPCTAHKPGPGDAECCEAQQRPQLAVSGTDTQAICHADPIHARAGHGHAGPGAGAAVLGALAGHQGADRVER